MATDDELAQTATAPASPSALAALPRATLARFRIDAILGEGGMGVVHAAFDPELERTIALKVLRKSGSDEARARLLREARAMAKLSHPNVIGVFEVGSADGQDFVAMELIDGETLGEWLRRVRPDLRAILAAFVSAGQGLAAAHAAGLVHRDFKPSNVLRSHTGKIVVTDFGLARTDQADVGAREDGSELTSSRTQTGAILGTPAYMAPEQWTGGLISAATDQFGFCVALWEALVGERPYRGDTFDVLKAAVLAGLPRGVDRVPRPLRSILLRGLATDAAQRWPSMPALIAALERVGRRRTGAIVGAVTFGVVAVAALAVLASRDPRSDECSPAALDPGRVWSANRAGALAMRDPGTAELVAGDLAAWSALRSRTCAAEPAEGQATLLCLDGALARLDHALGSALGRSGRLDADRFATELVDPRMCGRPSPPRLAALTAELSIVFEWARYAKGDDAPLTAEEVARADRVTSPCARAVRVTGGGPMSRFGMGWLAELEVVRDLVGQCDDDKIRAEVALQFAIGNDEPNFADAAVARFPQADLRASLETIHARDSARREQWNDAVTRFTHAIELYGVRHQVRSQVDVVLELARVRVERGRPEDLIAVQELARHWIPMAREPARSELHRRMLIARWHNGELAAADAELERLDATPETETPYSAALMWNGSVIGVSGQVVDQEGNPVANALVSSGAPIVADSATIAISQHTLAKRTTRTDADGKFNLVLARGTVLAQSGTLRSAATRVGRHIHLIVAPTSGLRGRVALGGTPASRVWIVARTASGSDDAAFVAPVREDGSFELDGVPRGKLVVGAVETGLVAVGARPRHVVVEGSRVDNILLEVTPPLYVIGRSADLVRPESAHVFVFANLDPGPHPTLDSVAELFADRSPRADNMRSVYAAKVERSYVPPSVAAHAQPGDMLAPIPDRPAGTLIACAVGFARKQFAGTSGAWPFGSGFMKQELACTRVAPGQLVVTIALPPMRKLTK